jgi:urea transport system ATP-binding protein
MLLELDNVSSFYGRTPTLKNISFKLDRGECLCVLGRNGVGKTTLVKTLMGLTDGADGKIQLDGKDIIKLPTHQRAAAGFGYVPQGRQILGAFTVKENIQLGTFAGRGNGAEIPPDCLELFPYLKENLDRRGGLLSGGQQQQLALARARARRPAVLLLDEPTDGIQPNIVREIGAMLLHLNREKGLTMILTEQHIKVARMIAHAFIIMDNGRIAAQGRIEDLTDEVVSQHMAL